MGLGEIGLECDGLAEGRLRLRLLPLVMQGDAEVVVRLGEIRLECDGLAVGRLRLRMLPLVAQGDAEVVVASAKSGLSAMALRKAASASACFLWSHRATPRLL